MAYRYYTRRRTAKLNRKQIMAAYEIYQRGHTVPQIADLIWKKFEFKNPIACQDSLYSAFDSYGRKLRTRNEALRKRFQGIKCRCGCPLDERTISCKSCQSRHKSRKRNYLKDPLNNLPPAITKGCCSKCKCDFNQRTKGCSACTQRHNKRRNRKEKEPFGSFS